MRWPYHARTTPDVDQTVTKIDGRLHYEPRLEYKVLGMPTTRPRCSRGGRQGCAGSGASGVGGSGAFLVAARWVLVRCGGVAYGFLCGGEPYVSGGLWVVGRGFGVAGDVVHAPV